MLDSLNIINYKCHSETQIDLKPFTLLVGTNSSGKSSVIQALLLAVHNSSANNLNSPLNGHLVSVGNFSEARNLINNAKTFEIGISKKRNNLKLQFSPKDNDGKMEHAKVEFIKNSEPLRAYLDYAAKNIHYLSANRIGGQDLYNRNFDEYDTYGLNGEFAVDYLQHNKKFPLEKALLEDTSSKTLEAQVNYWLESIFGHKVETSPIENTDKVIAKFSGQLETLKLRPKNIGSGVSFAMSIIIACLSSKKGDVIIIENPEIHLHPKAQSALAEFFTMISNSGRQVIIETHSDHIFNGLRVRVNKKKIDISSVSINFFTLTGGNRPVSKHTKILLDSSGRITNGEDFLFDQFENDLRSLIGIR